MLLFGGLRLLVSNWRLTLVTVLPAMWIWLAMFDLKVHVLHGKTFHVIRGPILIPVCLAIVAITMGSFYLNAVFAFAIAKPGRPEVRPGVAQARQHLTPILVSGAVVGALLAFAAMIVTRWGHPWFGISLSIVVGRDDGLLRGRAGAADRRKAEAVAARQADDERGRWRDRRHRVHAAIPARAARDADARLEGPADPGIFVLAIGITLQAGATGAVRAIKLSASLTAGHHFEHVPPERVAQ